LPKPAPDDQKNPLAELVRLLEKDEALAAITRTRQETLAGSLPRQREHSPTSQTGKLVSGSSEAAEPKRQSGHNAWQDTVDRPGRRGFRFRMLAFLLGLALIGCASLVGYFAWLSEPRGSAQFSLMKVDTSGQKARRKARERNDHRGEEANLSAAPLAPPGGETPPLPASQPTAIIGPASDGEPKSQSTLQMPQVTGAPSGPATMSRQTAPPNEPATVPAAPIVEPQVSPTALAPAPPSSLTPGVSSPASVITEAKSSDEPSAPPPPHGAAPGRTYVVQLSSQRSEKAAQATAETLRAKYRNIFGDRQPFIRRSDLRERGVYFRALVGTFPTVGEATQFCGELKKVGGQCIVQKN
jgi:hypothetical protein